MRRPFALVAVLLAVQLPSVAASQETRPSASSRLVVFEHDAKDVTGFVLYMRGSEGALLRFDLGPLAPDASGRISAPLPVNLPNGTYRVQVAAYNLSGESARIDAEPAVTRVTWGTAPRVQPKAQASAGQAPPPAAAAPAGPKTEPKPEPKAEPKTDAPAKRRGLFGRLKTVVIGDDED